MLRLPLSNLNLLLTTLPMVMVVLTAVPPGTSDSAPTAARKFERMIAANETLLYFGGCMIVLLLAAWVMLALVKNRLFASSKVVRPAKVGVVKNVWAESGRRMETPPAPGGQGGRNDEGGGGSEGDEPPPDQYPPPGNAL